MEDTTVVTPVHKQIQGFMELLFSKESSMTVAQLDLFVKILRETGKQSSVYGATKHTELSYVSEDDYGSFINLTGATDGTKRVIVIDMSLMDDFRSTVVPNLKTADVLQQVRNYLRLAVNHIAGTSISNPLLEAFLADYVTATEPMSGVHVLTKRHGDCLTTYIYWK